MNNLENEYFTEENKLKIIRFLKLWIENSIDKKVKDIKIAYVFSRKTEEVLEKRVLIGYTVIFEDGKKADYNLDVKCKL